MRKRIAIAFLAVNLLACQNAFISMAEEGVDGTDSATAAAAPAEASVTEDAAEDDQEAAEGEGATEPAEQAGQMESLASDVPIIAGGQKRKLSLKQRKRKNLKKLRPRRCRRQTQVWRTRWRHMRSRQRQIGLHMEGMKTRTG